MRKPTKRQARWANALDVHMRYHRHLPITYRSFTDCTCIIANTAGKATEITAYETAIERYLWYMTCAICHYATIINIHETLELCGFIQSFRIYCYFGLRLFIADYENNDKIKRKIRFVELSSMQVLFWFGVRWLVSLISCYIIFDVLPMDVIVNNNNSLILTSHNLATLDCGLAARRLRPRLPPDPRTPSVHVSHARGQIH